MHFSWEFTLGNLVTVVAGIVALIAGYVKMGDRVDVAVSRLDKQEKEMDEYSKLSISAMLNQHERRLVAIETAVSNIAAIQADIGWIRMFISKTQADKNEN